VLPVRYRLICGARGSHSQNDKNSRPYTRLRGVEQLAARKAHNLEVGGSNPPSPIFQFPERDSMTKRDEQAKEYAEESGSLDGYHPMVRDFILGQGRFSQEKEKEMHERVWRKLQERVSGAMVAALREGFAVVDKKWEQFKQPVADDKCEKTPQGMRTERITLEVTHDLDALLSDWIVEVVDESLGLMETVRVVEEAHFDDLAQVAMERDAAIRERDELKARVAEDGRQGPLPTLEAVIERQQQARALACVKDGFARLDEAWAMMPKSVSGSSAPDPENKGNSMATDGLRTERVVLEIAHTNRKSAFDWQWPMVLDWHSVGRTTKSVRVVEEFGTALPKVVEDMAAEIKRLDAQRDAAIRERDELKARVAALQAASGGGEGEPVAWIYKGEPWFDGNRWHDKQELTTDERLAKWKDKDAFPLYRQPPQPRGWLTEEEREALESARLHLSCLDGDDEATERECKWSSDVFGRLLARSSPPEVVAPASYAVEHPQPPRDLEWRDALAAAGVTVKEVT
jgi:hypothetical protein